MDWMIALAIAALGLLALPVLLRRAKSPKAKGSMGGLIMAFGMAFTILLDPAKKAAIENIEKNKDIGGAADDAAAGPSTISNIEISP